MTNPFLPACPLSDLPPGTKKHITLAGRDLVLISLNGTIHALDNACPHRGGPLSEGDLEGDLLYCPLHAWSFDVKTGASVSPPGAKVARFQVQVADGVVYVSPFPT
jgi:nitrite reductase/ring-hydroxylating ferredoxin subunit